MPKSKGLLSDSKKHKSHESKSGTYFDGTPKKVEGEFSAKIVQAKIKEILCRCYPLKWCSQISLWTQIAGLTPEKRPSQMKGTPQFLLYKRMSSYLTSMQKAGLAISERCGSENDWKWHTSMPFITEEAADAATVNVVLNNQPATFTITGMQMTDAGVELEGTLTTK